MESEWLSPNPVRGVSVVESWTSLVHDNTFWDGSSSVTFRATELKNFRRPRDKGACKSWAQEAKNGLRTWLSRTKENVELRVLLDELFFGFAFTNQFCPWHGCCFLKLMELMA
ncbi:hypothetical protein E2320_012643, partial [Naja naja]